MSPRLLKALQALEPQLRSDFPDAITASVNITLDQNGTVYSYNATDSNGNSDAGSKRIVREKKV